jgi:uncharacterized membrane protein
MNNERRIMCQVCKKDWPAEEVIPAEMVRQPVYELIRKEHPDWTLEGFICLSDLNHYRAKYVEDVLESEKGELSSLEKEVLRSIQDEALLSRDLNKKFKEQLSLGEKISDKVAVFGGSWKFIISFMAVLFLWILINSLVFIFKPFDPYPYILLNLMLSCIAALQAPVIMMSQNRQETKDRLRSKQDYQVNLKAELEIRSLHEKIDHLIFKQWHRLLEIQKIQLDLMEELSHQNQ